MEYFYNDIKIILNENVLDVFTKNRQTLINKFEIGGQLFGYKKDNVFNVLVASVSKEIDFQSEVDFCPNKKYDQEEINSYYEKNLDFLGNWHTHPENIPNPSNCDICTMKDRFKKSNHNLPFFILIIVGRSGLSVNIISKEKIVRLKECQKK